MPEPPMVALVRRLRERPGNAASAVSPSEFAPVLGVDGVSASLIDVDDGLIAWHMLWCADSVSEALNSLRYRVAEGPSVHAVLSNTTVLVPTLASPSVHDRWPRYTKEALALGVQAVFAFPLRGRSGPYGVVVAHRGRPGSLKSIDDARGLADALEHVLAPPRQG